MVRLIPFQVMPKKQILFFGDSLTAGYGIELEEAFPALTQKRIDSLNLDYIIINSICIDVKRLQIVCTLYHGRLLKISLAEL